MSAPAGGPAAGGRRTSAMPSERAPRPADRRLEALRGHPRPRGRRLRLPPRHHPRRARRERRRQVDADQDHRRACCGPTPARCASPAGRSPSPTRPRPPRAGIVCIFQELSLIPDLTVADNISLADPPKRLGLIDRAAQRRRAEALLARIQLRGRRPARARPRPQPLAPADGRDRQGDRPRPLGPDPRRGDLGADQPRRRDRLRAARATSRREGVASIFISHRMHEVEALCDTLSVFRNGRHIETFAKGARTGREIVRLMIGRDVEAQFPPKPDAPAPGAAALDVRGLRWENRLNGVDIASAAARSSASAASTARARRSCCSRSSASCAASRARSASATARGLPGLARRREVRQGPHRARPRGPQDRGADARPPDRRQPARRLLRRGLPRAVHRRGPRPRRDRRARSRSSGSRSAAPRTRSPPSPAATSRRWSSPSG